MASGRQFVRFEIAGDRFFPFAWRWRRATLVRKARLDADGNVVEPEVRNPVSPALEWRQVDFDAGEIRLDAGTTKNREGRVFPMTNDLRAVLKAQYAEHERLKKASQFEPWLFWRMVAEERGGQKKPKPIRSLNKAWKIACRAAGCPGRIPHDRRRTAVRNLVRAGVPQTWR